ncbi:hypothetical protein GCM10022221_10110 [Actinocorallia aurea]
MNELRRSIADGLAEVSEGRPVIVLSARDVDASHWEELLTDAGSERLVISLEKETQAHRRVSGPTSHIALHHETIARLTLGPSPLDDFDPSGRAVLIVPDPLNPPLTGSRPRLGPRLPAWALVEDKMLVDPLWDLAGITRAVSVTSDLGPDLASLAAAVDEGGGIVASCQRRGHGPRSGAEGIWWWRGPTPPQGIPATDADLRVRLMPLLEGLPCRIHGMVTASEVSVFPPLELLSLPRPSTGTFLWAGAVPLSSALRPPWLEGIARRIGLFLRDRFGYRGPFASDGVLTADGYRPTELTTRLTSAFESAPARLRVLLHAATVLARREVPLPDLTGLAIEALASETVDVFGSSTDAGCAPFDQDITWDGIRCVPADADPQGSVVLRPWIRGWQLRASLKVRHLPEGVPIGLLAPSVFRMADERFGTAFGTVTPPFGLSLPKPRMP